MNNPYDANNPQSPFGLMSIAAPQPMFAPQMPPSMPQQPQPPLPMPALEPIPKPVTPFQGLQNAAANTQNVTNDSMQRIGANNGQLDALSARLQAKAAEHQARMLKIDQLEQTHYQDEIAKINSATDELAAAKVDPHRMFAGWNGVLAGVSMALGQLGAAFTHGPNAAMQLIDAAVSRDIEAQKEEIASRRASLSGRQNMLQINMQRFGDMRQAEMAAQLQIYQQVGLEAQNISSKTHNEQLLQNAAQVGEHAAARVFDARTKLDAMAQEKAHQKAMESLTRRGQDLTYGAQMANVSATRDAAEMKLNEEQRKRYVSGVGLALDPQAAAEARKITGATNSALDAIQNLLDLRRKNRGATFEGQDVIDAERYRQQAIRAFPIIANTGVMNESERKYFETLIGSADKISFDTRGASNDPGKYQDMVTRGFESMIKSMSNEAAAKLQPLMEPDAPAYKPPAARVLDDLQAQPRQEATNVAGDAEYMAPITGGKY